MLQYYTENKMISLKQNGFHFCFNPILHQNVRGNVILVI